jgi:GMP synthase (glutamine-hydrolysing)
MLTLIQNDHEVPAGNFLEWLHDYKLPFRIIKPYSGEGLPSLADSSALIVLGGAMGVNDSCRFPYLVSVKSHIQQAVNRNIPLLGVCLGGQLLADVLGAPVLSQRNGELGSHTVEVLESGASDPLFLDVPQVFTTFQWHNDSFEIPAGATCLAASPACAHQAFRYGDNQYGLQFHPEVTRDIVASWIESFGTVDDSSHILNDFICNEDVYTAVSRKLLENFLRIAHVFR